MQILKDLIKQKIVSSAREEFYKNGYKNSSMRSIATSSNITVGNLYKYFNDKEELFSFVIASAYKKFQQLFSHHSHSRELLNEHLSADTIRKILEDIVFIFSNYQKEFLIIIDGSEGTKFEKARKNLLQLVEGNLLFHMKSMKFLKKPSALILSKSVGVGFMEGLFEILREEKNKDNIKELISDYFMFFIRGIIGNPR
jgi:AcrR family transcriptional regulator